MRIIPQNRPPIEIGSEMIKDPICNAITSAPLPVIHSAAHALGLLYIHLQEGEAQSFSMGIHFQ